MNIHFTKIERTAGIFVFVAFLAFVFFTVVVAVKQGWFATRHHFKTTFAQGEGLHPGTMVQMAGLRAGSVEAVSLNDENKIEVLISVPHEFQKRIHEDSVARVIRPFIIGDKVVEVTVGSPNSPLVPEGATIVSQDTMDIMDLLGGGRIGPYLSTIDNLLKNLQEVAQAFSDPKRSRAVIRMFDETLPAMRNLSKLADSMNKMIPDVMEFSKHLPEMGENGTKTLAQLVTLTEEMNKLIPIMAQIAPQLPEASQKSVEALKESVIVLRAMQKSFLLRGAVKDVKEEDEQKHREPAGK